MNPFSLRRLPPEAIPQKTAKTLEVEKNRAYFSHKYISESQSVLSLVKNSNKEIKDLGVQIVKLGGDYFN